MHSSEPRSLFIIFFLLGSGLAEYVPILLLRLCRFSQISPGSVLVQPLCWSHSEREGGVSATADPFTDSSMTYEELTSQL